MPVYFVKVKGNRKPARIEAAKMEESEIFGYLTAKDAKGKIIAKFDRSSVAGWWKEGEAEPAKETGKKK